MPQTVGFLYFASWLKNSEPISYPQRCLNREGHFLDVVHSDLTLKQRVGWCQEDVTEGGLPFSTAFTEGGLSFSYPQRGWVGFLSRPIKGWVGFLSSDNSSAYYRTPPQPKADLVLSDPQTLSRYRTIRVVYRPSPLSDVVLIGRRGKFPADYYRTY